MGKSRSEQVAQMLLFKTGDLAELQQLAALVDQNLHSARILADGLRDAMNRERIAIGEAIRDLKATAVTVQQLADMVAGVVCELKEVDKVEFVDLDANFVPVDLPTQED